METLLERAKEHRRYDPRCQRQVNDDEIAVVIAWAKGEINTEQLRHAYGDKQHTASVYKAATVIRRAVQRGRLEMRAK